MYAIVRATIKQLEKNLKYSPLNFSNKPKRKVPSKTENRNQFMPSK
jgi:hypothetical protein